MAMTSTDSFLYQKPQAREIKKNNRGWSDYRMHWEHVLELVLLCFYPQNPAWLPFKSNSSPVLSSTLPSSLLSACHPPLSCSPFIRFYTSFLYLIFSTLPSSVFLFMPFFTPLHFPLFSSHSFFPSFLLCCLLLSPILSSFSSSPPLHLFSSYSSFLPFFSLFFSPFSALHTLPLLFLIPYIPPAISSLPLPSTSHFLPSPFWHILSFLSCSLSKLVHIFNRISPFLQYRYLLTILSYPEILFCGINTKI